MFCASLQKVAADDVLQPRRIIRVSDRAYRSLPRRTILSVDAITLFGFGSDALLGDADPALIGLAIDAIWNWDAQY